MNKTVPEGYRLDYIIDRVMYEHDLTIYPIRARAHNACNDLAWNTDEHLKKIWRFVTPTLRDLGMSYASDRV